MKSSTIENQSNNYLHIINAHMSQHFIFNTLNSINSFIIDNDAKIATEYVSKFGKLMRLVIEHSNKKTITLAKEIEALELYVLLEKMRYSGVFNLEIKIAKNIDAKHLMVPALLLQPYLESAIWQNISGEALQQKIILEVMLSDKANMQYIITDRKSTIKAKLFQPLLPHLAKEKLQQAQQWTEENRSKFEVNLIDLYNEFNEVVAQKTIITIHNIQD